MKKRLALLLCFMMTFSLASCILEPAAPRDTAANTTAANLPTGNTPVGNEESTTETPKTSTSFDKYKPVFDVYRMAVDEIKDLYSFESATSREVAAELFGAEPSTEKDWFLSFIDAIWYFYGGFSENDSTSPHHKLSCGYAIKDLNGDGVDELVLLTDDYMVCAIFSITGGQPILLRSFRARVYGWIDGDGLIHENVSGGTAYSTNAVYKIADGGASMELVVEFGTNGVEWVGDTAYTVYYKLVNGEKVNITEAEIDAFTKQYGEYLGYPKCAEATKAASGLQFTAMYTEAEIAMEMYEAAINDEICVFDERLGEIKLKDCRFPSDNLRLDECEFLNKAILDMDGDGINEYIIQSATKDHIVLRYYEGKVYSYCFDSNDLYNLNTDGSFYWRRLSESEGFCVGLNQLSFDGSSPVVKEIYKIVVCFAEKTPMAYYMSGKQITSDEYSVYYNNNSKRFASFCPFDLSCEYPISSEDAYAIASKQWRTEDGHTEGACGKTLVSRIVILEKPNDDTMSYRICLQVEAYNHVNHGWESQTPWITVHNELLVNAITGKVREHDSIPSQPSENETAMEMYGAAINDEICVFDERVGEIKLKDLRFASNDTRLDECKNL